MAISISDEPRLAERVRVSTSAVVDLLFSMYRCTILRAKHGEGPLSAHPALINRIAAFWADAPGDFSEALVLAHHAETLLGDDPGPFLDSLEATAGEDFPIPSFPTETQEDARTIVSHLTELRQSQAKRQAYAALWRDVARALAPALQAAQPAVARATAELHAALQEASSIEQVMPARLLEWCEITAPLVAPAVERGELVIIPMALAQSGRLYFALPGVLILAFAPDAAHRPVTVDRSAAERVALRYKVLSDPTRLQLLGSLLRDETTVSELADLYGLSQPTVSVHVKQLREAGLLKSERHGAQTFYRADEERVRDLLGASLANLLP